MISFCVLTVCFVFCRSYHCWKYIDKIVVTVLTGRQMPRTYVPHTPGTRNYASSYTKTDVEQALASVGTGTSIRQAAKEFNIPLGTLYNEVHQKHGGIAGGQTTLTADEEDRLVSVLQTLSIWRCPVDNYELRVLVKSMIDKSGRVVAKFKNDTVLPLSPSTCDHR